MTCPKFLKQFLTSSETSLKTTCNVIPKTTYMIISSIKLIPYNLLIMVLVHCLKHCSFIGENPASKSNGIIGNVILLTIKAPDG